ncbi:MULTISPECIES: DEAD/DEAH box helicase [Aliiglaciecola]|uniref:DEAD/DEAH box helicase n=1 Tax=Aliiglaciecola TaxID=1406885 RepID=UPI001C09FFD8|nr:MULTISPECIES: DEAD/DEAH box helicase [Aliiglaciecola]MBU2878729.1 DEAD/DEAH box helicase [Aliiglaciecola lipolytica]MDO6711374.1 DEAD/DEAH box helicase [Aliiglaciecola sp. 2_MG-2023]MDO6752177.1 DEAD/DEAH box helicase [Aliiglaciecola sp. 1_MG-2023]
MSEFVKKLTLKAMASDDFKSASNELFRSYIFKMVGGNGELDRKHVKQLASVAQYLYQVNDSKFRKEGAALLSMLIDVSGDTYPEVIGIANKVFSSAGDFPNITLIENNYPELNFRYSFYSEAEMEFRQELNTVEELNFPLTDFQRTLWENLMSDNDVITVAPTSAGKTHIILSYLTRRMIDSDGAFAAIIVPTRALISEVASKLYEIAKEQSFEQEIEICTVPQDGGYADRTFFVMTQERLFDALQSGDISFNFLFIDEAHNIADESRGVLLHLTIDKLLENSFPQVIVSMPSASYQDSFSSVFKDVEFKKEITSFSPVAKIMMEVKLVGRELAINRLNTNDSIRIPKNFTGLHLADISLRLGQGQSNIIYRNQTDHCENIAQNIASKIDSFDTTDELEEAADYVEKFIHNRFTLANNLRKGVAFHYGPLPSSLRVLIENLVKEDQIKFVACTSTLAEGVNLPAKNLFLFKPMQSKGRGAPERLDDVKINNITGRAGRMLEHFAGNIFIVEPDEWQVDDYFDENDGDEDKIPTYYKALNEELVFVFQALAGTFAHDEDNQYKFYTIANKLIKEIAEGKLYNTLESPELELSQHEITALENAVKIAYRSLKVAPFTLEASPTIGYIQQNKLFNFLNGIDDLTDWILPHPKSKSLYSVLVKVCEKLEEFGVYAPTGEYHMSYMCVIAAKWVQGDSLKEIINEQILWMEKRKNKGDGINPNKAVRDVIKVINNDIRFRMANALRCYQVLLTNVIALKKLELSSTKLHTFIEIGASDDRVIELINIGLSREASKEINETLADNIEVGSLHKLLELLNNDVLAGIHPITRKEILSMSK